MELFITTGGIFAKGKKWKYPMKNVLNPQPIILMHHRNWLTPWPRITRTRVITIIILLFKDIGNYGIRAHTAIDRVPRSSFCGRACMHDQCLRGSFFPFFFFYFLYFSIPLLLFSYLQLLWGPRQGCEYGAWWGRDLLAVFFWNLREGALSGYVFLLNVC